jgi:uncharacterized delta-60 repeat protein
MTLFECGKRACLVVLFALSAACGGGGDGGDSGGGNNPPPPPPPGNTGIGSAGGTVTEPSGAKVVIPAGALATNVDIKVTQTSAGAPALPAGVTAAGAVFAFTPHGTTFAVSATITVPFDPALVPAGATPRAVQDQCRPDGIRAADRRRDQRCEHVGASDELLVRGRGHRSAAATAAAGRSRSGFGSAGKVITHFGGKNTAMALQDDGKIVMVGGSILDFLLARYNADGSLDESFGVGGLVTTDIGNFTQEEARAVAMQPDGKIIVAGNIRDSRVVGGTLSDKFFFTLVRYNTDGSLDTSFNGSASCAARPLVVPSRSRCRVTARSSRRGDDATDTPFSVATSGSRASTPTGAPMRASATRVC